MSPGSSKRWGADGMSDPPSPEDKDEVLEKLTLLWHTRWDALAKESLIRGRELWKIVDSFPQTHTPVNSAQDRMPRLRDRVWYLEDKIIMTREAGADLILEGWIRGSKTTTNLKTVYHNIFQNRCVGINREDFIELGKFLKEYTHLKPRVTQPLPLVTAAPPVAIRWPSNMQFDELFAALKSQADWQKELADDPKRDEVARILLKEKNIVILAGAGISVAAGIPCFRGDGGLLTRKNGRSGSTGSVFDASVLLELRGFEQHARDMGRLAAQCQRAQPTPFHIMLGFLATGPLLRLYSMNIDGLETRLETLRTYYPLPKQLVQAPVTILLHGELQTAVCSVCRQRKQLDPVAFENFEVKKLECRQCPMSSERNRITRETNAKKAGTDAREMRKGKAGLLRPAVVLYDEIEDHESDDLKHRHAIMKDDCSRAETVIVVGTSASKRVAGLQRFITDLSQERGQSKSKPRMVWIGLESPPRTLRNLFEIVLDCDCQDLAKAYFKNGGEDQMDKWVEDINT
ncbi:DHS-like NAD/FAD-binding domain-containing protein [Cadophora sp. DSE1049]|nr:DHS-like NAD/FAD-binding domain-containing protein [Cadophora sp. DSE1049]